MSELTVCTVITRDRAAHARVLANSLHATNGGSRLVALLLDDPDRTLHDEPYEIVRPGELALEPAEFQTMTELYDGLELACAMKPWAIEHALGLADAALYLDSDIEVFASLAPLLALAREHSLVLTPHLTEPPPLALEPGEEATRLAGGVYNNGFLGVSRAARPFLEWWRSRLARHCRNDLANGYFVDQRWVDLAPAYFPFHALRDPGANVAAWNLITRRVEETAGGYLVDGVPLRFFHFSGFDPERPYLLSKWLLPSPHTLLSEHPVLARICKEYARRLVAAANGDPASS